MRRKKFVQILDTCSEIFTVLEKNEINPVGKIAKNQSGGVRFL